MSDLRFEPLTLSMGDGSALSDDSSVCCLVRGYSLRKGLFCSVSRNYHEVIKSIHKINMSDLGFEPLTLGMEYGLHFLIIFMLLT